MNAWDLAASVPWTMEGESLRALLEIAGRDGDGPEAVAARLGRPLDNTRGVTVRDGVAIVPVVGPIFRRANLLTQISGATSVEVLARDLREAMSNPKVHAVLLEVDSPGGEANGVGELAAMVHAMRAQKPISAYIGGRAAPALTGSPLRVSGWRWRIRRRPAALGSWRCTGRGRNGVRSSSSPRSPRTSARTWRRRRGAARCSGSWTTSPRCSSGTWPAIAGSRKRRCSRGSEPAGCWSERRRWKRGWRTVSGRLRGC